MMDSKYILEQLTKSYKINDDLKNIEVKFDSEDKALLSLNSLPRPYEHFKEKINMKELVVDNIGECLNFSRIICEGR